MQDRAQLLHLYEQEGSRGIEGPGCGACGSHTPHPRVDMAPQPHSARLSLRRDIAGPMARPRRQLRETSDHALGTLHTQNRHCVQNRHYLFCTFRDSDVRV
jgi:hypothetical protein